MTEKAKFLQELLSNGLRVFATSEAKSIALKIGLNESYINIVLNKLVHEGWLKQIKRGVYSLSYLTGVSPIHEFEIAMRLVRPAMISHYSAFYHHELTEQLPRDIFITTIKETSTPQKGKKKKKAGIQLDGVNYQIVQLKKEKFFGGIKAFRGEGSFMITSLERTLLDGLAQPQYCGGFAEVVAGFEERIQDVNIDLIIQYAMQLGVAVARRLGWVLETLKVAPEKISSLAMTDKPGYRKLNATNIAQGRYSAKWKLQLNY